ncbi:MAG: ABC transporter permease, partial [Rhodothermales bacterium]
MFDLDKSLAAWRSSYTQRRAFSTEDLDELEQHIRDQVAEEIAEGETPQTAFDRAMKDMGAWDAAEQEYGKVFWHKAKRQRRLSEELNWRYAMFKSYFLVALRAMRKQKSYTFINTFGLATGLACFILIILFVKHEFAYDQFYENSDNIYRIIVQEPDDFYLGTDMWAVTPAPLAQALMEEYAEVKRATVFDDFRSEKALLSSGNQHFWEKGFWGDEHFFGVFSSPFILGEASTVLKNPDSIVLNQTLANKIFGDTNPVGQQLTLENDMEYTVTGVFEDLPETSSLKYDFVVSLQSQDYYALNMENNTWTNSSWQTFFVLANNAKGSALEAKLPDLISKNIPGQKSNEAPLRYFVQPLLDVHLKSNFNGEKAFTGDITQVYIFLTIACLILLLACINYINLAIARSAKRIKEVGLRKVVGAGRRQLFVQFIGESIFMAFTAFLIALVLVLLLQEPFSTLMQRPIALSLQESTLLPALCILALLVGILSGIYPAFYMSRQQPSLIMKGMGAGKGSRHALQRGLIIGQYTASIALVVCGLIIYQQLQFVQQKDLGYDRDQVLTIPVNDMMLINNFDVLKNEWLSNPQIKAVAYTRHLPTSINSSTTIRGWAGSVESDRMSIYEAAVSDAFLDVFNIKLIAGRMFSKDRPNDLENSYVINETAAKALGTSSIEAIGSTFMHNDEPRTIVGVIEDFHIHSMHMAIKPFMIRLEQNRTGYFALKV